MPAVTGVNVADALTTQGRLVGIVTAAVARVEAIVPLSVVETAMLPPVCPLTTTITVVPGGMFVPVSVSVTGFAIAAGSVMSGMLNDAVGAAGVTTPPMAVIVRVGPLASATADGSATDGAMALTLRTALFV